ncbi:MAG: CoA transferase, partial [bacterium]|nr:CoA transferase [bacterium]
ENLLQDEHGAQHAMLLEIPRPDSAEPLRVVGNPMKLSRVAEGPVTRFPRLGEHTEQVLGEVLELDGNALRDLRERGVI